MKLLYMNYATLYTRQCTSWHVNNNLSHAILVHYMGNTHVTKPATFC